MKVQVLKKKKEKLYIWTHEGPCIEKKIEREKCGHMKDHEKKEIAMLSKEFI